MATPTGVGAGTEPVSRIPSDVQSAADSAFDNSYTDDKKVADATAALGAPAAPEGSTPEGQAAPEVKAQEAAVSNTPSEAKPTDAEPAEWKNLLAKYNGDRAAAGKAYWETNNRAAELARKNEELARQLEAAKAGSPPAPQAPSPVEQQLVPELRWFQQEILSVENDYRSKHQEHALYTQEQSKLDQTIGTLRRRITTGGLEVDKDQLQSQLLESLDARDQVRNYLTHLDSEMSKIDRSWQSLGNQQKLAQRVLDQDRQLRQDREAKDRASEETQTNQFRQSWNGTIETVAKDVSAVPASSSEAFVKFVKAKGMAQVASGEPIADVEKFVRDQAAEFKGMLDAESDHRFASYSKNKVADTTLNGPSGKAALAPKTESPRTSWTPQQWEDHYENNPPF